MDEIHDHKMSSDPAQKYSQHLRNQKGENLVEEKGSNCIKETRAHSVTSRNGNKEACANNPSNPPSDSLCRKTIILTKESGL